ncbi:hypothetical protein K492DRAFT_186265 [Lichtheimia hyalospora FSU 10163]|nr:hypothetical protein K492DRAFT_186265 [Lichtheimia hyalospora FSU 10163]
MSSDMNKENMDPGGENAFQPRQQKMQEDYGQSSATDFDQTHQRPQRAVVVDPMQQAPIHQEPPSKELTSQQTSGVDNETARKTAMHTNNPFVVRENQQAATVRPGMPSLPAAGVFDLDAAGNSSIITGYDNDPRSFNMRTAKQVAANHDKFISDQPKQTSTTRSKGAIPPGRKSSASAWTSSSVTGGAAVAAAAAATATGGGIMAKCVDYLRGSQQQASQDSMDEDIASPIKDDAGGMGQYGPLESKDHPEFTEDINDVWKNTGPGAAISRGGHYTVFGGETAPDVGDYGPLNARDHPEFIENVGDPWKSTGPGAAIARGPEDNLVGDTTDTTKRHPFTEKVDDPWKQTSASGTGRASDFSKSRMAAGGIAAGTLGTGVGAAGTSAFDNQSESSTRAMKSDDGNDMIHVDDEDAQPLMKEPREDVVAESYRDPTMEEPDDTQAFGVGTREHQERGIQSDYDTFGQPRDTSWEDPNTNVSKGKTYAAAAGGGAAGAGIGAMAAEAARKRHQQDQDWSGQQKRRSTDQGVTSGYDKAYSKGGPGIGAVPMPAGDDSAKQQPGYFAPSTGTQPDTKPMRHDRRLSVEEQTNIACTAGGLGSNVDQSASGTTAAKQPPGSHIDSGKKMTSAAIGAGAGAATGAGIGAANIGQKDIEDACTKAGLGSNVDQSPPTTRAPMAGSTMKKNAAATGTGAAGATRYQRKSSTEQEEITEACKAAGLGANVDQSASGPITQAPGSTLPSQQQQPSTTGAKSAAIGAGAGAGVGAAGAKRYQRKSSTEQEEIAEACKAAGLGANVDQSASGPMTQAPGSTLPSQQQQPSTTGAKSAAIGAGAGAGVGAAIGAVTASGGTDMTKDASERAAANYQKQENVPKGGFLEDLDDSTSAADPYSATRQYHSTREPLHINRKDDDVGTGGTGDDIYDPYAKQGADTTAMGGKKPSQAVETGRIPEREKDQSAYTLGDPTRERQQSGNAGTAVAEGAALGGATGAAMGAGTLGMSKKQHDEPSKDIPMQDNHHPLARDTQQQGQRNLGKEPMGVADTQPTSTTGKDMSKQKQQPYGTTTTQDFGNQQQPKDTVPQPRKSSDQAAEARQEQHARSVPQVLDGAVGGIDPTRVGNMSSTKDAYATTGGGGAATAGGIAAMGGAGAGALGAGMSTGDQGATDMAGQGARRTSVQDYVTGMFDARRGSIKEKFGKFFHKQNMQQEGKDLQNVGNQKVQSFISQRRQSQGRAGM